jgi:hypothetical protein
LTTILIYQNLGGAPPGAKHAFPRQWHMHRRGVYLFLSRFSSLYDDIRGWMTGRMDGWKKFHEKRPRHLLLKDQKRQIYPNILACLRALCGEYMLGLLLILISKSWGWPPPGVEHAFPKQRHMCKGGGYLFMPRVFFPVWCHPWMDDRTDGWMDEKSFMKNDHDVLYYM